MNEMGFSEDKNSVGERDIQKERKLDIPSAQIVGIETEWGDIAEGTFVPNLPYSKGEAPMLGDGVIDVLVIGNSEDGLIKSELELLALEPDNGAAFLGQAMDRITGYDLNHNKAASLVNHIKEGNEKGKRVLSVIGHGGGNPWKIRVDKDGRSAVTDLLENLSTILGDQNSDLRNGLDARYSTILLNSCNEEAVLLDSEVVNALGIPIAYQTAISGLFRSRPETMQLDFPSVKKSVIEKLLQTARAAKLPLAKRKRYVL